MYLKGARHQAPAHGQLVRMTFRIPHDLYEAVTDAARDARLSRTAWIVSILARHLGYPEHDLTRPTNE